jgi:hypothetical protein
LRIPIAHHQSSSGVLAKFFLASRPWPIVTNLEIRKRSDLRSRKESNTGSKEGRDARGQMAEGGTFNVRVGKSNGSGNQPAQDDEAISRDTPTTTDTK